LDAPGGVCEQVLADTTKAKKLANIISTVNSADNLAFLIKKVETPKGIFTRSFLATASNSDIPPFTFLAFENYLEQTQHRSVQVAATLDAVITKEFGKAHAGVAVKWNQYLKQANEHASQILTSLHTSQGEAKAEAEANKKAKNKAKKDKQKAKKKGQK
jgi:hypothetical protein